MSDFSQNGIISNLHDFGTKNTKEIEIELKKFSKKENGINSSIFILRT